MVAFAAVLLLGILQGVMVAVVVSLLLLIRRAAHPNVAFLGRIPGTRSYSDVERNPDNEAVPRALVVRVEAALVARHFTIRECDRVRSAVREVSSSAKRPSPRDFERANGRHLRPAGTRSPSADASGGEVQMNLGPETAYAAWRQA